MIIRTLLLILVFAVELLFARSNVVSNLQGEYSVNNGTFLYEVPLNMPPGVAGTQPQLSLVYNSNGGNGYFGIGWSLKGLSGISRCGLNKYFDGVNRDVKYDNTDNICLDGERLVVVSGSKWDADSEYRTKIDSYAKIVFDGENFTVWTKNGEIKKYTLINNSWLLTQVSDRYNNSIYYKYTHNKSEIYIKEIRYANNKIVFNYQRRNDTLNGFNAGRTFQMTQRVTSIDIKSDNTLLRTYKLQYAKNLKHYKSILKRITECSHGQCLEPLKFRYSNQDSGSIFTESDIAIKAKDVVFGDFNGDSFIDIYHNNTIAFGKGNGTFKNKQNMDELLILKSEMDQRLAKMIRFSDIKIIDLDQDGDIDIIAKTSAKMNFILINDGSGKFYEKILPSINNFDLNKIKFGDFDGDGKIDILYQDQVYVQQQDYDFKRTYIIATQFHSKDNVQAVQFNNDNYTDLLEVVASQNQSSNINIYFNNEIFFRRKTTLNISGSVDKIKIIDINNDGLVDIVSNEEIYLNKGDKTFVKTKASSYFDGDISDIQFVDIDGDGIVDVVKKENNQIVITLYDSNGKPSGKTQEIPLNISLDKISFVDIDSNGFVDIVVKDSGKVWLNKTKTIKLVHLSDSFDNVIDITYKKLNTSSTFYKQYHDAISPSIDLQSSDEVVSRVITYTSDHKPIKTNYTYEGLKARIDGLGSLGFAKISVHNVTYKTKTEIFTSQKFPFIGLPILTKNYVDGELVSSTKNKYQFTTRLSSQNGMNYIKQRYVPQNSIYQVYKSKETTKTYENGELLKEVIVTNSDIDRYGNIRRVVSQTIDGVTGKEFLQTTLNTYLNDSTHWILSRLIRSKVIYEANNDRKMRTVSFTYDNKTGILTSETVEPQSSQWLKKSYTYDKHGNKIKEVVTGANIKKRETKFQYDRLGKFLVKIINPLGHIEKRVYDKEGQLLKIISPGHLTISYVYDHFGKKIKEVRPDGTKTIYRYDFDHSLPNSYYRISIKSDGAPPVVSYFSKLNKKLRTTKIGFRGRTIVEDFYYDVYGNLIQQSMPYFIDEEPSYVYMYYDKYQRIIKTDVPASNGERAISTTTYYQNTIKQTNAKGQVKITTQNVLGKTIEVEDNQNSYIHYTYDAIGNLIETTDAQGNTIKIKYDSLGNKIYQKDPDMGTWLYKYNALDELIWQKDAKGNTTIIKYDLLGRKVYEKVAGAVSRWVYDKNVKGQLYQEIRSGFRKTFTYDKFARLSKLTTKIDGKTFIKSYKYDKYSRLITTTLPKKFQIKNVYNKFGYLEAIKSPRKQIKDFDPEHFVTLIQQTLRDAIENHKKAQEYRYKAKKYKVQAKYYTAMAKKYIKYKTQYLNYAKKLNNIAKRYSYFASRYKRYSSYYKRRADIYLNRANRYKGRGWWGNRISRYLTRLSYYYRWYAQQYAYWANYFIKKSLQYRKEAQKYISLVEKANHYEHIIANAIKESKKALEIAKGYEQKAQNGYQVNYAYQQMLTDSSYNYFYKVLEQDSYGHVIKYISGNGLITNNEYDKSGTLIHISTGYSFDDPIRELNFEYDLLANVTRREDIKLGVEQTYEYDELNRLVSAISSTRNTYDTMTYTYDAIGNMLSKSDVGEYTYSSTKPHQVIQAGKKYFQYDANGNMTNNNGTLIEYTPFNKVAKITTKKDVVQFNYDPEKKRYKKTTKTSTTYYLDKSYEHIIKQSTREDKYYIYANGKVVAIYTDSDNNPATKYLHYDSLGSVDTVTNNLGVVESRMAYKPFGERLNLDVNGNITKKPPQTNRGYTGHEHIDETPFINMNARIYDPTIARFMSADSIIPDMYDTQAYNRYSYVKNNPLKYIDPSGHSWLSKTWHKVTNWVKKNWKTVVTVVVVVVVTYITAGAGTPIASSFGVSNAVATGIINGAVGGAIAGFTAGVVGTVLAGGDIHQAFNNGLKGALVGSISGAVAGGIGGYFGHSASFFNPGQEGILNATEKALVHGISRAGIAKAQGQSARAGFWSGFISSAFATPAEYGMIKGTAITAAVSGTISEITGGKFANGAVTGAFIHLFNTMADPRLNGKVGRAMGGDGGISDTQADFNSKLLVGVVSFSPFGIMTALSNATKIGLMMIANSIKNIYYSGSVMLGANYTRVISGAEIINDIYNDSMPPSTPIGQINYMRTHTGDLP